MKKWLTILLLVISITASFYPCCSKDNCCSDDITATNHNNHKAEGTCSPFVTCGSCPGFTQLTQTIEIPKPTMDKVVHNAIMETFLLPVYTNILWQPPRIA